MENKVKHTPGPWKYNGEFIEAFDGKPIFCEDRTAEQIEADAYLMAASLDLVEALGLALNWVGRKPCSDEEDSELLIIEDAISYALAKARGEIQ